MTQYRLLARAELHGAVRDPGYVFTLADGEKGPHRTVVASNHGAQIADRLNGTEELIDEPLYEEIKAEDEAALRATQRNALEARVTDLRKQLVEAEDALIAFGGGHDDSDLDPKA